MKDKKLREALKLFLEDYGYTLMDKGIVPIKSLFIDSSDDFLNFREKEFVKIEEVEEESKRIRIKLTKKLNKKIDAIMEYLGLEFYETERKESELKVRKKKK